MRELCIVKGKMEINTGGVAYAEQNPLIMTGTVREHIVFGSIFEENWYDEVVKACALDQDFK